MHGFTIDLNAAIVACETGVGLNKPVGGAKDNHGTFYSVFIRTYPQTDENGAPHPKAGQPVKLENGRVACNLRKSRRQDG